MPGYIGSWRAPALEAPRRLVAAAPRRAPPARSASTTRASTRSSRSTALSTPAGDLVANGRVAKFLIDPRAAGDPVVHFVNGNFTTRRHGARRGEVPLLLRPGRPRHPRVARRVQRVTYFTPDQALRRRRRPHLPPRRRRPSRSTGCSSTPRTSSREDGIVAVAAVVAAQVRHPRRPARLRADRVAADHGHHRRDARRRAGLDVAARSTRSSARSATCRSTPARPGATCGSSRAGQRLAPDRHPGVRRAAARPVGRRRRAHQGRAGHQLARQPEVQGAQAPRTWCCATPAPDNPRLRRGADQPVHFVVRADDFVLEPTTDEVVAAKLRRADGPAAASRCESTPETEVRTFDEMAAGTPAAALAGLARASAPRPPTSASSPTARVLGRPSARSARRASSAATTWCPAGVAVPLCVLPGPRRPPAERASCAPRSTQLVDGERSGDPRRRSSPRWSTTCSGVPGRRSSRRATSPRSRPRSPRDAARRREGQGALQRQRRGHPELRRRRAARQLRAKSPRLDEAELPVRRRWR